MHRSVHEKLFFLNVPKSRLSSSYFTMVELIVVIAVLTLLFSILQPSINRALEVAELVSCQKKLKQIGVAYQLYPEDHGGWLIRGGSMYWEYELKDYLNVSFPASVSQYRNFDAKGTIFECDSYDYSDDIAAPLYGGYAYNTIYLGNTREEQRVHYSKIQSAGETLVIGDGMNYIENNRRYHILYKPSYIPWHYENGYGDFVYTRHDIGLNIVWVDGHASYENWFELKAGKGGDVNYYYKVEK